MTDPLLEGMSQIAVPLDEWCDLCEMKLAVGESADGIKACGECMKEVLAAMEKHEAELKEAMAVRVRQNGIPVRPKAAKAKAKRRAKRKRTKR